MWQGNYSESEYPSTGATNVSETSRVSYQCCVNDNRGDCLLQKICPSPGINIETYKGTNKMCRQEI